MKLKNISDLAPEIIVWQDIVQHEETWSRTADIESWLLDKADCHVEQVGFIIAEDEHSLLISDSFIESDEMYGNVTKIPKSVVLKRIKLVES